MSNSMEFIDRLEEGVAATRQRFINLSENSLLTRILGGNISWAIIGGAVRDTLFTNCLGGYSLFNTWRDLDIGVASSLSELPIVKYPSSISESARVDYNYFGGLKIYERTLGYLDVWTCTQCERNNLEIGDWMHLLETIDFGLNGIAFLWPQKEIIIHPQLNDDLRNRRIEKLSKIVANRQIQAIRALALVTKCEQIFGITMGLGDGIKSDIKWLLVEAEEKEVLEALNYLRGKVESGRWPARTLDVLFKTCKRMKSSQKFSLLLERFLLLKVSLRSSAWLSPKKERGHWL